jgi:hypothetical protein
MGLFGELAGGRFQGEPVGQVAVFRFAPRPRGQGHPIKAAELVVVGLLLAGVDILAGQAQLCQDANVIAGLFAKLPFQAVFGRLALFQLAAGQGQEGAHRDHQNPALLVHGDAVGPRALMVDFTRQGLAELPGRFGPPLCPRGKPQLDRRLRHQHLAHAAGAEAAAGA